MRIFYAIKRFDACYYLRARIPMSHLSLRGHDIREAPVQHDFQCPHCKNKQTQEVNLDYPGDVYNCKFCFVPLMNKLNEWKAAVFDNIKWCDVAVFQRNTEKAQLELLLEAKRLGKFTVVEGDDDYFNIPVRNSGKTYYDARRKTIEEMFRQCHGVTVTTSSLRNVYLPLNKNISVIPNAYDVEIYDVTPPIQMVYIWDKRNVPVTMEQFENIRQGRKFICWAGSPTHAEDLELVREAIGKLIKDKNVLVGMCAYLDGYMKKFYPQENLFAFGIVPNNAWYAMLKYLKPDVWIAPVVKNKFNQSKSNIKYLEAIMMGSAFVGSDFDTYNQEDFRGYLVDNSKNNSWFYEMRRALNESPEEKAENNEHNRKILLEKFDIKSTVNQWDSFFKNGVSS